jgi:hypothetical protein
MVNSGLGIFVFLSSATSIHSGNFYLAFKKIRWAPFNAERTSAFQMRKFDHVSFSVMGWSTETLTEPRPEEATMVF